MSTTAPRVRRTAARLLYDRTVGTYFWGKLFSSVGTWLHGIVAAVVVYAATGSAFMVGMVSVVQFTPQLFLGPLSGKYADRGHALTQIVLGRLLTVAGSGALAAWFALRPESSTASTPAAVLVATAVVGLGFVVSGPAQQSIVPRMVHADELAAAMSLNTMPMTLGRVLGPAVGAVITSVWGPAAAFGTAAVLQAVFLLAVAVARLPRGERPSAGSDLSVNSAARFVLADRPTVLILAVVAAVGCASEPAMTLAPSIADKLGGGTVTVGLLSGGFGLGAAVGFVALSLLDRVLSTARLTFVGMWTIVAGLTVAALSGHASLSVLAFVLVGSGFTVGLTTASTLLQRRTPGHLRGRIMAFWMIAFVGSRPAAAALTGMLADVWSVGAAILAVAVSLGVLTWWATPRRLDPAAEEAV